MNQNNRTEERRPLRKECIIECIIGNQFSWIEAQTVDISRMGLRIKTDRTLPFKNGCELSILIQRMEPPQGKLMWTKKDFNNSTRLGLKFQLPFPDFTHKYFPV